MESSYGDIPMNNGNMIVERNDRFIIFKMVVRIITNFIVSIAISQSIWS